MSSKPFSTMKAVVDIVEASGLAGIQPSDIAHKLLTLRQNIERPLQRLLARGEIVNVRVSYRCSMYYVPRFAPKAPERVYVPTPKPARTTQIRDMRLTATDGDAIVTPRTKITSVAAPPGRYAFNPPKGWVGEITKDWRARRLEGLR